MFTSPNNSAALESIKLMNILRDDLTTQTKRLNWMMRHANGIELDKDNVSNYITAYLSSGDSPDGVAGKFISRGNDHFDCIDNFINKKINRIS